MITITNNGIYRSDFSIVELRNPEHLDIIPDDEIIGYLSEEVELGESITFERLFEIIIENKDKFDEIYHSCLGGYSLTPFIDEVDDIPTEKSDLEYLQVFWHADKSENEITIVSGLHGIGVENYDEGPYKKGDTIAYAVDFTPLNNLKYLNVRLNKEVTIMNYDRSDDENFHIDLGNKSFTVFDLFYAILFEISWNGDPKGREGRLSELEESIELSEKDIEEGRTHTMEDLEDFFEKMEKNDKYLVKYKEQRDRVDEELSLNSNLKSLKSCLLEKLRIYDKIENSTEDLTKYYKKLTDNEFNMQILYGLDENINYHRFWETPKCTCPKIDNVVNFPNGNYTFDKDCPIHKKTSQ